MAGFGISYSRFVSWLKVLLPLLALAILSTMFMVSRTIDPSQSIPFADADPTKLARDQGISNPHFTSLSNDGSAITFSAKLAKPDPKNPQLIYADDLTGKIETSAQTTINIRAAQGQLDNENARATLTGNVRVSTSAGYNIITEQVLASLDATYIAADQKITADGPMGNIVADSMLMSKPASTNIGDDYVVVFKGGVKLIYVPGQQ